MISEGDTVHLKSNNRTGKVVKLGKSQGKFGKDFVMLVIVKFPDGETVRYAPMEFDKLFKETVK